MAPIDRSARSGADLSESPLSDHESGHVPSRTIFPIHSWGAQSLGLFGPGNAAPLFFNPAEAEAKEFDPSDGPTASRFYKLPAGQSVRRAGYSAGSHALAKGADPPSPVLDLPLTRSISSAEDGRRSPDLYPPLLPARTESNSPFGPDVTGRSPNSSYHEDAGRDSWAAAPEVPLEARCDPFWMLAFWMSFAATFATSLIVYLNTETPDRKHPIGDTIYNTLRHSYKLLLASILCSSIIAVGWLTLLRRHARLMVYCVIVAVPALLFAFFVYGFAWSFSSSPPEQRLQDKALRALSFVPLVVSVLWVVIILRARHSLDRALRILDFSLERVNQFPQLIGIGVAVLAVSAAWTWIWVLMFSRVFLGGHFSFRDRVFLIDISSWWLALFFCVVYMWTNGVLSGVQRVITAGTVSFWYFYRSELPDRSAERIVQSSFWHAVDVQFGTIALSAFLNIAIRLPLMVLPRRLGLILTYVVCCMMPTNVAMLTSPYTLTYSAIIYRPLAVGARDISSLKAAIPSVVEVDSWTGSNLSGSPEHVVDFTPHRLAKFLLSGVRYVICISTGLIVWVTASRNLITEIPPVTVAKGSVYAYVVALVAASISWYLCGAMESVLGSLMDALLICWAYDADLSARTSGDGVVRATSCLEANALFSAESEHPRLFYSSPD